MTTATLADEKYVLLTTKKKSGQTVGTPVWIAPLSDGAMGFTTELTSGKVKRIRNFSDVTLQPCNSRGVPKPGTAAVAATASVLSDGDVAPVEAAIKAKYGFMVALIDLTYTVRRVVTRKQPSPPGAVRLTLD